MVNVLTPAYPATDSPADQHAADLYNAFYTDFIMDGAFLGHYSARTLSLINEILRANNATLTVEDSDMEELAKAAPRNDMFGLNYYQSAFIAAYDGESTNSFNGTGDKGTSCFKFKGVGQQVDMPGIPTTDWDWLIYRKASTTRSSTSAPPIPTSPSSISPKTAWATRTPSPTQTASSPIPSASTLSTSTWRRCSGARRGRRRPGLLYLEPAGPVLVGQRL